MAGAGGRADSMACSRKVVAMSLVCPQTTLLWQQHESRAPILKLEMPVIRVSRDFAIFSFILSLQIQIYLELPIRIEKWTMTRSRSILNYLINWMHTYHNPGQFWVIESWLTARKEGIAAAEGRPLVKRSFRVMGRFIDSLPWSWTTAYFDKCCSSEILKSKDCGLL